MRIIYKYKEVALAIVLIVMGTAWLYTVNYDLSIWALFSIIAGVLFISECEVKDA